MKDNVNIGVDMGKEGGDTSAVSIMINGETVVLHGLFADAYISLLEDRESLKVLRSDFEFICKQVERALFSKHMTAPRAMWNIFHYPGAPWNNPAWEWDVSHTEYAATFKKSLGEKS